MSFYTSGDRSDHMTKINQSDGYAALPVYLTFDNFVFKISQIW